MTKTGKMIECEDELRVSPLAGSLSWGIRVHDFVVVQASLKLDRYI